MKRNTVTIFSLMIILSLFLAPMLTAAAPEVGPTIYIPLVDNNSQGNAPDPTDPNQPVSVAGFSHWKPITLQQVIPVNLVFIGYDPLAVKEFELLKTLPHSYKPVVRYPLFYGVEGRDMGLNFIFNYRVVKTTQDFQDQFFSYLQNIGKPGDPTVYQQAYNDMDKNILDVTSPVLYIDAPSVETWLKTNTKPLLFPTPEKSYTVYFINWYSRPDFKFHVYTKTDQADPDTGYNFGEKRDSRKLIAWGGSSSRAWFYDLSAGPEAWSNNYDVDNPDLDGNGVEDYRMPPIWEYDADGYRDPAELSHDLGLVTRYVAINLLFTTSPLYDPMYATPEVGGDKVAHIEMFQDDPASNGLDWIDLDFVKAKYTAFQPYYNWQVNLEDNKPIDTGSQRAFRIFAGVLGENDCWNAYGTPFAELFCYYDANLSKYVPAYDPNDYVGHLFAFNTTADNLGNQFGLLGFADDNWVDGTQSYVFEFDSEDYRTLGYGFSTTTVHEFGHHIGMSHPHDGYDAETGVDYGAADETYFAWSGDESNTIMHYMDLSTDFGQFDQDNMYRYQTAGYLNWSNELFHQILTNPGAMKVFPLLFKAMMFSKESVKDFYKWNYLDATKYALKAYETTVEAADQLGITLPAKPASVLPIGNVLHQGDPIRFPDN